LFFTGIFAPPPPPPPPSLSLSLSLSHTHTHTHTHAHVHAHAHTHAVCVELYVCVCFANGYIYSDCRRPVRISVCVHCCQGASACVCVCVGGGGIIADATSLPSTTPASLHTRLLQFCGISNLPPLPFGVGPEYDFLFEKRP
jgi:hypothetical protein